MEIPVQAIFSLALSVQAMGGTDVHYSPVGKCIYCGAEEGPLTKEHIIPYALNGDLVLPEASCAFHAKVTSEFERHVARESYGHWRAFSGAPTRRKQARSRLLEKKIPVEGKDLEGKPVTVEVYQSELPADPLSVFLSSPGILVDAPSDMEQSVTFSVNPDNEHSRRARAALKRRYGLSAVTYCSPWINAKDYCRLLAKIAHAYSCAELGVDCFEPYLLPLIEGAAVPATYWVGGFEPAQEQSLEDPTIRIEERDDRQLIVVDVSLHALPQCPRYQIVVGHYRETTYSY